MSKRREVLVENILTALANKWSGRRQRVLDKARKHANKARNLHGVYKSISTKYDEQAKKGLKKELGLNWPKIQQNSDKADSWLVKSFRQGKIANKWGNHKPITKNDSTTKSSLERIGLSTRERRLKQLGKKGFGRKWYQ